MQNIKPFSISAPGFLGLNLQDSPIEMPIGFALQAINCIIDKSGRVASRKGWTKAHTTNADLGTSNVECIVEHIDTNGTSTLLAAGGGFLFKHSGSTLTTLTYGGGGSAPTISANNWQVVILNRLAIFFQIGYDPLIYDPATSVTQFRRLSEHASYAGTVLQANCAISAYGRVWCANTATDKSTVKWSDVQAGQIWTGGSSGSLDLLSVWPLGGDEITALAAHNNFLYIFGRKQILIYQGATTPSTMTLYDSVVGIGCVARDSVQVIGDDIIFLSATGIRSLARTIQEKSAPMAEISRNVRDEIQSHINVETGNIKSGYDPINAFYILTAPTSTESYCFDLRKLLEDGSARATTWNIAPRAFCSTSTRKLYLGRAGYIGEYTGYLDDTATYRMSYYITWVDLGNPIQRSILKRINAYVLGVNNQNIVFKWGFDFDENYRSESVAVSTSSTPSEYNIAEYNIGEYSSGLGISKVSVNAGGHGQSVQLGFEAVINGYSLSIQKVDIFTKDGKY